MPTKLARNLLIGLLVIPLLYSTALFHSLLFHVLQTALIVLFLAVRFAPAWPDKNMDPTTAACVNKERCLPSGATTHMVLVCYFDDCPAFEDVVNAKKILLEYDRFTSVPIPMPNAFETRWKKVNVKIEDFVLQINVKDEEELNEQVSGLTTGQIRPLDPKRPLWRVDILCNANGRSAVVFLVDHCIGDGLGLMATSLRYATKLDGTPFTFGDFQPNRGSAKQSPLSMLKRAFRDVVEILGVPNGPFDTFCGLNRNSEKPKLIFHPNQRAVCSIPDFELADILKIKSKLGNEYTVNDILIALWAGCLRRYLIETKDPILDSKEKILVRGQVPVGLPRPTVKGEIYCKITFVVFHFPVGAESLKERMRLVHEEFHIIKNSFKLYLVDLIAKTLLKLGLDALLADSTFKQWHKTSWIFSNVPGPKEEIKMFGKKLVSFKPFYCNLIHQAMFFSYANKVSLAMVIDTDSIKRPEILGKLFLEELEEAKKELNVEN